MGSSVVFGRKVAGMIDRALVEKIARAAIVAYQESGLLGTEAATTEAVLQTVDAFTPAPPSHDEIEDEIDRINMEYLALNARQAVLHYLREGWAKERIAWRKHLEGHSR